MNCKETIVAISGVTDETATPYQGHMVNIDWQGGTDWVDIVHYTDPASTVSRFDNGGVPIGEAGERYFKAHRQTQVSDQMLRIDRPSLTATLDGSGHVMHITTGGGGYPPYFASRALVFDQTRVNPDWYANFICDIYGRITGWTNLPPYTYTVNPVISADPPPQVGKEVKGDVSPTRCMSRQLPDGYFLANGSLVAFEPVEAPGQRNGVGVGLVNYASHYIRILSNAYDDPKAEHVWCTASPPGDQWNGDREGATLSGDGLLVHGYRDGWPTIYGRSPYDLSFLQSEGANGTVLFGVHTVAGHLVGFIQVSARDSYPGGDLIRFEQRGGGLASGQMSTLYLGESGQRLEVTGTQLRYWDGVTWHVIA